ncbi:MAG: outer membrane protein transport protein [Kiritimatiellae bacterium]|nr:outer membrane protein transport protein [Kiritimatiellia bacterium]
MKVCKTSVVAMAAAMSAGAALGAGFGLYEASARGNAMGGGLVGSTGDATANYYNPANLTESTNITFTVGVSFINPFCDVTVDGRRQQKMDAGWFPPPHAYVAAPITEDLVFGFGSFCEYGLGTKYDNDWALKGDTTETTIEQFTFNPNIAYKITEDWSVAFGARMSYITFENYKTMTIPVPQLNSVFPGRVHLEGDDFNCGYMLATQYKVTDDLDVGIVYRSRINHRIEGDFDLNSRPKNISGDASAKLVLPASVTMGANYDFTKKFRGGAALTWTEWSTINHIDFNIPMPRTQELNWHDAWRVGFGFEYDFTEAFCGRIGYSYDWDPSADAHGTTMLPPGDRHIVGFGIGYKILEDLRIDLGYNFIMMESETRMMAAQDSSNGAERIFRFECDNSYSHIASVSLTYSF